MFLLLHLAINQTTGIDEVSGKEGFSQTIEPHLINDMYVKDISPRKGKMPHEPGVSIKFTSEATLDYMESMNDVIRQLAARADVETFEVPPEPEPEPESQSEPEPESEAEAELDSDEQLQNPDNWDFEAAIERPANVAAAPKKKGTKK
jgi:hypothetical protein